MPVMRDGDGYLPSPLPVEMLIPGGVLPEDVDFVSFRYDMSREYGAGTQGEMQLKIARVAPHMGREQLPLEEIPPSLANAIREYVKPSMAYYPPSRMQWNLHTYVLNQSFFDIYGSCIDLNATCIVGPVPLAPRLLVSTQLHPVLIAMLRRWVDRS